MTLATKTKKKGASEKHVPAKRRDIKARKPDDYDNERESRRETNIPPGNECLNLSLCSVNLMMPRYKEGPLYFRPFPALDWEKPQEILQPGRTSARDHGQGHWIRGVDCASYIGLPDCDKFTFCLYPSSTPKNERARNPWRVFYRACQQAHDAGQFGPGRKWRGDWNPLLKGSKKGGASITKFTKLWFIQAAVYANGETNYMEEREVPYGLGADDDLVVIQLKSGAAVGIMDVLDRKKKDFDGDPEANNHTASFRYGDPVGRFNPKDKTLTGGVIMAVYNPLHCKNTFRDPKTKKLVGTSWDGKKPESGIWGYEGAVLRELTLDGDTYKPDLGADEVQRIFDIGQFWFDDPNDPSQKGLIRIPSLEEQCLMIAKAFKSAGKLVQFAWGDHDEFFTDEVKAVLSARVSAVIPDEDEDEDEDEEGDEDEAPRKRKAKKDTTQAAGKKGKGKTKPKDEDEEEEENEFEDDDEDSDSDDEGDEDEGDEDSDEEEGDDDSDEEGDDDSDSDEDEDSDDDSDEEEGDDEEEEEGDDDSDEDEEGDDDSDSDEEEEDGDEDSDEEGDDDSDEEEGDEDEDSDEEGDDDSDEEGDDDSDEEEEEGDDEEEEEDKPKPSGKKKTGKKPAASETTDDEDYFKDDTVVSAPTGKKKTGKDNPVEAGKKNEEATRKAMQAAKEAKDRSAKRKSAAKPPPAPPSKGGKAKKK